MTLRWFSRSELLLGEEALARFNGASVAIFGLGGVGSFVVEALARTGVGHLRLVDHDIVAASNMNRQLFALRSTLGRNKVEVAKERVLDINPDCHVDARHAFIRAESLPELLDPMPDVIVDAIDSMSCKIALLKLAHERGIPVVSAMGAGGRKESAQLRATDLSETVNCPLAARVRKYLRQDGIETGIRCISSLEPADNKRPANPLDAEAHRGPGRARRPLGTVSYMPGIAGLKVAEEVMHILLHGPVEPPAPKPVKKPRVRKKKS